MSRNQPRVYCLHAVAPLHVGSGRGGGFIDLPLVRETTTGWPFVPGSSVKGMLSEWHGANTNGGRDTTTPDNYLRRLAFGVAHNSMASAGALAFTDARLVCLPVRSLYGTFAWCTCPFALARLQRDLSWSNWPDDPPSVTFGTKENVGEGTTSPKAAVAKPSEKSCRLLSGGRLYLEDLEFTPEKKTSPATANAAAWASVIGNLAFPSDADWQSLFTERFVVVHDNVFNYFANHATQVDARIRINPDTRTVADGQLWYEESLPIESLLIGLAKCGPIIGRDKKAEEILRAKADKEDAKHDWIVGDEDLPMSDVLCAAIAAKFASDSAMMQLGGKASVGRGQVKLSFFAPRHETGEHASTNQDGE